MKNIHVLPTDKPSRLWINNLIQGKLELSKEALPYNTAQQIYITSDEEIKEGDWYLFFMDETPDLLQCQDSSEADRCNGKIFSIGKASKKIILTTNQDLIKDGVQAIDENFLKWFVKNPSCEEVEVEWVDFSQSYFIKIPKEETLEENLEEIKNIRIWLKDRKQRFIEQFKNK